MTILGRHDQDELLLLASDGLWDVLSNQVRCLDPLVFVNSLHPDLATCTDSWLDCVC